MTLEQCKRRYSKATLAASKASARYDKFLQRLWFELPAGRNVNALKIFRYLGWDGGLYCPVSLEKVEENFGEPVLGICVTLRKHGDKVSLMGLGAPTTTAAKAALEKGAALYDAIAKAEDTAAEYKLALHDDFKMSYTEISDLYRGI